jgi:hypothetical protein
MKNFIVSLIVLCCLICSQSISAQTNYRDVVYLKNGSVVKGIIIENIPNDQIKLQTSDGNLFVYKYVDILKFGKEEATATKTSTPEIADVKHPGLSFLFSFLVPGGGQYYNGQITKGIIMTGLYVGSIATIYATANSDDNGTVAGVCALVALSDYIWSMIDAPITASSINRQHREGLLSLQLGKEQYLSLNPDIALAPKAIGDKPTSVFGLKLKLSL